MKRSKEEIASTSKNLGTTINNLGLDKMPDCIDSKVGIANRYNLENNILDLADYVRGILTPSESILFLASAIMYAKEGMLGEFGLKPDPTKDSTRYLLQIDRVVSDIWQKVLSQRYLDFQNDPLAKLSSNRFTDDDAAKAFKMLTREMLFSKATGEFTQPEALTDLMIGLLDYKGGTVYNPFAGIGSFGIALGPNATYVGEEIDSRVYTYGLMNLMIHGVNPKDYHNEDSFVARRGDSFDYIISVPPFNLKLNGINSFAPNSFGKKENSMSSFSGEMNDYILLSSASRLNPQGKAVCLCSSSITYSERSAETRKDLIKRNVVDAIISLPAGIFRTTNIASVAIVLRNGRKENDPILLVDASRGYTAGKSVKQLDAQRLLKDIAGRNAVSVNVVTLDEISGKDCSWLAAHYAKFDSSSLVDGYQFKRIGDLTEEPNHYFMPIPEHSFPEITAAILTASPYDFRVQAAITDPTDPEWRRPSKNVRIIYTEPTFFISTIGKPKFGFVQASEESPVYAADGFIGYRLKKEILPEYFAIKLADCDLESFLVGSGIRRLRPKDLAEVQIPVPSLEEQEAVVKKMYAGHNVSLGREQELEQAMIRMKKEFDDVNGMNQHNLATPAAQIKATCQKMQLELKCGNIEETSALLERQLLQIQNLLASVYGLENGVGFGEKESFNFDEYLTRYNKASYSDKFKVSYYLDTIGLDEAELEPVISVNGSAFMQAVMNIIRNAEKHGFTDKSRNDYAITIDVHLDPSGKYFLFEFSNNGNPLPDGMDAERYGTKGDSSGDGKGFGGYYVKKMSEAFGGCIDVSSVPITGKEGRYLTTITIKLPVMEDEL